jgi:5-methylcytosine-specific restriction enzyme A
MPIRPLKPCAYPGCSELVPAGQTYCEKHRKKEISRRNREYNLYQRDEKASKFYGSAQWRSIRDRKMKVNPLCEICLAEGRYTAATEVDHKIPIEIDWSKRLDWNNLQPLCHRCHMKKTAEDRRKYG